MNVTTIALDLDTEVFSEIGAIASGEPSPLSPWPAGVNDSTERLEQWLIANGQDPRAISPELRSAVAGIAGATGATSVQYESGPTIIEFASFKAAHHGPVGLTTTNGAQLRLEDPAPVDRVVETLSAFLGRSRLRFLDVAVDLTVNDALVFAVLVDDQRRQYLRGLADRGPTTPAPTALDSVRVGLESAGTDASQFVNIVAAAARVEPALAAGTVAESMGRLAIAGLIDLTGRAAALAGQCAALAHRFAVISGHITYQNLRPDAAGSLVAKSLSCVQAGVIDLLSIECVGSQVQLQTLSADTLLTFIDGALRQPDAA
jgi:hypothetical protein